MIQPANLDPDPINDAESLVASQETLAIESSYYLPPDIVSGPALYDAIADKLASEGVAVFSCPLAESSLEAMLQHLRNLPSSQFKQAGIGRDDMHQIARDIRNDRIHWLGAEDTEAAEYLAWAEELRNELNSRLFMGLFEYECHYAAYPAGGFYRKHLDSFRGGNERVLSSVLYLNHDWLPGDGGELDIFCEEPNEQILCSLEPRFGTMVLFLSEAFPHQVRESFKPRFSVTGWYRLNSSHNNQINPEG